MSAQLILTQLDLFGGLSGRPLTSWVHGRQQYLVNLDSSLCAFTFSILIFGHPPLFVLPSTMDGP